RMPELLPRIRDGLKLFEQSPPTGVRVETQDGAHYVQYSFWPGLRIINGFVQSLVGLYDVAQITGDARAARLFAEGDRAARAELPRFDTGAWSLYSRDAITRESDLHYHTLLRDFLTSLCDRTDTDVYCTAESHFTGYLTTPPELALRTTRLRGGATRTLRFSLSKISRASVRVTAPSGRTVLAVAAGVVGRGTRSVAWRVPRRAGYYTVRIDATDLAGNAARFEGPVEVLKPKRRKRAAG
ncbi:MAG TPA: D-glucuronyl C5-epimerase family protein, partial [Solirubrobacteraceae bacterium]|nr:D-glucuronyl C5-epimerase family protein [Solirubrobacteraceae bacterium]